MKVIKVLVIFLTYAWSGYASAFSCSGQVVSVAIGPTNGTLQVNAGYGVHYLCRLHTEYNGVHPEICKAWYSMFLSAQASGRPVHQYYDASIASVARMEWNEIRGYLGGSTREKQREI